MDTKYFAYYIPENKPILMNNILNNLKEKNDICNAHIINNLIESNIQVNDWFPIIGENIIQNLNSLVLVKFILVNDIFTDVDGDTFNTKYKNYTKISENTTNFKTKYANKDHSIHKIYQALFSGTKEHNYVINDNVQYIFSEIITIPLTGIMNLYNELQFDNNVTKIFNKQLNTYIKKGEMNNKSIQIILKLTNYILEKVKYSKSYENYRHLQQFIPLIIDAQIDANGSSLVKQLWENYLFKQPEDPYEILRNHRLITNNDTITIVDDKNRFTLNGQIFSKLYITTTKKFTDITYKDALPFKNYFITKESSITDTQFTYNNKVNKITYLEAKIASINKCNVIQTEIVKKQNDDSIKSIKEDIAILKNSLYEFDNEYKKHILINTQIGFRLTFNYFLNGYKPILYMRYVCNNKDRLSNNFLFKYKQYNTIDFIKYDITYFYINNNLIDDIISLKIKADLFTISRLFKITIVDKFKDDKFKIINHNINSTHTLDNNSNTSSSLNKFNNFLDKYIDLKLFDYQKNNVLWMLKLEDDIDKEKLTVNSFVDNYKINYDHIEDIKLYLNNLRCKCPEAFLKNYIITHNGQKLVIDIQKDATIAKCTSIISIIDYENYRNNNNYDFDSNIINSILPKDEYIKNYSKPIKLCGGAICDEVGLGKTLTMISHLVVKMKDDTDKYNNYQNKMSTLLKKIKSIPTDATDTFEFEDPLENAFEYNNLIIVPSRLTSQWETEIVKYVHNKFNLKAKVLVGINSIKMVEKELHSFYEKQKKEKENEKNKNKENKNENNCKEKISKKITIKKNTKNVINPVIEPIIEPIVKPIIEHIVNTPLINILNNNINIDIDINDNDNVEVTENKEMTQIQNNKLSREKKMIEKLMKNAKKQNEKNEKNKNTKQIIFEKPIEKLIEKPIEKPIGNTLQNLINGYNEPTINIEIENNDVSVSIENTETTNNIITEDKYEYINKYFKEDLEIPISSSSYQPLYDIYIVSINLLSNENYLDYICHNQNNHLKPHITGESKEECNSNKITKIKNFYSGPSKICRLTDKFDIFKIKWNRVILDEAHEKLTPVVKLFSTSLHKFNTGSSTVRIHTEDQFLFENICIINSNYKWAMTGTPIQNGIDNIMGILEFLTKKNQNENLFTKMEKVRYLSDIVGISKNNMDQLMGNIFKKTYKKDVKMLLNIPIFSEEIIYVEQSNIERNIYNTIRCSRHFTESVRMRRLFLMCTNILINEGYDLDNNNEITTETLTLEQLNANMITKFTQQIVQLDKNKILAEQTIDQFNLHTLDWVNISNYVNNYFRNLDANLQIESVILQELQDKFEDLDRPIVKTQCEIFYNILNIFELWKEPSTISAVFISNMNMIKTHLYRIWKPYFMYENVLYKCAWFGAKLGKIKINEDIAKKRKQLETIANDKKRINNQIALFSNNEFLKEKTSDPCIICFEPLIDVVVTPCRHIFCLECTKRMSNELKANFTCPECRTPLTCNSLNVTSVDMILKKKEAETVSVEEVKKKTVVNKDLSDIENKLGEEWKINCINKYGSKMAMLVEYLYKIFENTENRVIIFSQYEKMLRLIGVTLEEFKIKFVYCCGNTYVLNRNINKFKKDDSYRVIMLSSENSNSGTNLTEANYIIFIDVLFDNIEKVKAMESQAIARSLRIGQLRPVKVVRFITTNTVESEYFNQNRYDMSILQN